MKILIIIKKILVKIQLDILKKKKKKDRKEDSS